jgi:hypothetical protein
MRLRFKGIVESGNDSRCIGDDETKAGAIFIGGADVVAEMSNHSGRFTFGIADQSFEGELFVETGWGYSEYTPMESDTLKVGDHDLIEILRRYEGQEITLFAFNEPGANILSEDWRDIKGEENSNSSQQPNGGAIAQ